MDDKEKQLEQKKKEFIEMLGKRNVFFNLPNETKDDMIRRVIRIVPTKTSIYRTSRGLGSVCNKVKQAAKAEVYSYLFEQIKSIFNKSDLTQESYKKWFEDTCEELTKRFNNKISSSCNGGASRHLTLGHAQKWISMAMKYFYCSDLIDFNVDYCYCPIYNIIKEKALEKQSESGKPENLKGLVKPTSWSKIERIEDLRDIYSDIDAIIKQHNLNCTQLEFDVLNWQ